MSINTEEPFQYKNLESGIGQRIIKLWKET